MIISEHELRHMYWDREMPQLEIAKEVGIHCNTVGNLMRRYGIDTRTKSKSKLIGTCMLSKEELEEMYWDMGMSQPEIAREVGVCQSIVFGWMQKHGIKSRTNSESVLGENNGNWNGGASFKPYCYKFNNAFKEAVRKRDDYICQLCGYEQKSGDQKLDVHHIHYDKENCYPDVVALCRSCNASVNGNRDYWEEYFENQLLERGMLNRIIDDNVA